MNKRQILINAIMSVIQVVVTSCILLLLYRFLIRTIGVEKLGIWSVVLSTSSVAGITNLGLSGSVVKFVAKYLAKDEQKTVAVVIQTAIISVGIFCGLILLIVYPFASWLLSLVIPYNNLGEAISILPYSLISLWIMMIMGILQSGFDGSQRIGLRSIIFMTSTLFHLILSFVMVPRYGLMGLAYARVIQTFMLFVGSWFILKRIIPILPIIPYQWDKKMFREMIGYGLNFQVISIARMLCEPVTKALLSRFGGLSMVGYYQMADRMIKQLRALIVSANQVLVPVIADLQERSPNFVQKIYKDNYYLMFYIALPFFSIIVILIPLISKIWLGHYEAVFVIFSFLLAVNSFINILSVPAYFLYLGIGELKWNTLGHVMAAIANMGLGFVFGYFYGGIAVVIAWILSSISCSVTIAVSYHFKYKIPLSELIPTQSRKIVLACMFSVFVTFLLYNQFYQYFTLITLITIILLLFFAIIVPFIWYHPMRKRLISLVANELLNRNI